MKIYLSDNTRIFASRSIVQILLDSPATSLDLWEPPILRKIAGETYFLHQSTHRSFFKIHRPTSRQREMSAERRSSTISALKIEVSTC